MSTAHVPLAQIPDVPNLPIVDDDGAVLKPLPPARIYDEEGLLQSLADFTHNEIEPHFPHKPNAPNSNSQVKLRFTPPFELVWDKLQAWTQSNGDPLTFVELIVPTNPGLGNHLQIPTLPGFWPAFVMSFQQVADGHTVTSSLFRSTNADPTMCWGPNTPHPKMWHIQGCATVIMHRVSTNPNLVLDMDKRRPCMSPMNVSAQENQEFRMILGFATELYIAAMERGETFGIIKTKLDPK